MCCCLFPASGPAFLPHEQGPSALGPGVCVSWRISAEGPPIAYLVPVSLA